MHFVMQQRRATKHILLHDYMQQSAASLLRCLRGVIVARPARSAVGVVRCGPRVVGSQAFSSTTAFNANIGSWNTASVSNMKGVCELRTLGITQRATEVRTWQWPGASSRGADADQLVPAQMWRSIVEM